MFKKYAAIFAVSITINSGITANKTPDMSKPRQILRLYSQGDKKLKIGKLTGISRNTLKKYIKIFQHLELTMNEVEALCDKELDQLFGENLVQEPSERYKTLETLFPAIEKELKRRGMTGRYSGRDTLPGIRMVTDYHSLNTITSSG